MRGLTNPTDLNGSNSNDTRVDSYFCWTPVNYIMDAVLPNGEFVMKYIHKRFHALSVCFLYKPNLKYRDYDKLIGASWSRLGSHTFVNIASGNDFVHVRCRPSHVSRIYCQLEQT